MSNNITIVVETRGQTVTAYRVGINGSDGSDFKSFVGRGTDRSEVLEIVACVFAPKAVMVFPGTFDQWLQSVTQ